MEHSASQNRHKFTTLNSVNRKTEHSKAMLQYHELDEETRIKQLSDVQVKVARRYAFIYLVPGLIILILLSLTSLTSAFFVVKGEYASHNSTRNGTVMSDNHSGMGFSALALEWKVFIISSSVLTAYYLLYLVIIIVGIVIAPDSASVDSTSEEFKPTKEFLMKYLIFVLILPFVFVILLAIVLIIAVVLFGAKDAKCDCNCNASMPDLSCCFYMWLWNVNYRGGCGNDLIFLCYGCMYWESRQSYYRRHQVIYVKQNVVVQQQPHYQQPPQHPYQQQYQDVNQTQQQGMMPYQQHEVQSYQIMPVDEHQRLNGIKPV
jgi:hypothetical protein